MAKRTLTLLSLLAMVGLAGSAQAQTCSAFSYAPGNGSYGLVEFEDLWPVLGDRDFNDQSTAYNYVFVYDTDGLIIGMQATFHVVSIGASIPNGLYLQLPLDPSVIASAQLSLGGAAGVATAPLSQLPSQHTACTQGRATFQIAADTRALYGGAGGFINTETAQPIRADSAVVLSLSFSPPLSALSTGTPPFLDVGLAPFDLFLARTADGSHQIHLPGYRGDQSCADASLFGTGDDGSNRDLSSSGGADNTNRYYVDTNGLPFGLNIPQYVDWPIEKTPIDSLYGQLDDFALHGGTTSTSWYLPANESTQYAWQANVSNGPPAPPPAPPAVGSGLFTNITLGCAQASTCNVNGGDQFFPAPPTLPMSAPVVIASGPTGPAGLALGCDGILYVTNYNTGDITRIDLNVEPPGVSTFFSGLSGPGGILVEPDGNIVVAERDAGDVLRIPVVGGAPGAATVLLSGFAGPWGLLRESTGALLISDEFGTAVTRLAQDGTTSIARDNLDGPLVMKFDLEGNYYVDEYAGNTGPRVDQFDPGFNFLRYFLGFDGPAGIAVDAANNFYVSNYSGENVIRTTQSGDQVVIADGLSGPQEMVFDALGRLYLADFDDGTVVRIGSGQ